MAPFSLREARSADLPFLRAMLVAAAYWRPGEEPGEIAAALSRPDLRYLLDGWGRRGDVGVIAERGAEPLGAAWFRTWTRQLHSYGFVDEETPEIAVGVVPEERGRGIGTALLRRLLELAGEGGFQQLSLSVEHDNPARRLYQRLGFRPYEEVGGAITLVLRLVPERGSSGREA